MDIYNLLVYTFGYNNYYNGTYYYNKNDIQLIKTDLFNKNYKHYYEIRDRYTKRICQVVITNNGLELKDYKCSCSTFTNSNKCEHIPAVISKNYEYIFSHEYVDEKEATMKILNSYFNNLKNKKNTIKEKLNIELEFNFYDNCIELKPKIGLNKLYIFNENKLSNFYESYKNGEEFQVGKQFTYSPDNHYLEENDKKLLEYIMSENSYNYRKLIFNFRDFESILNYCKNKNFTITRYGIINNICEGMPTSYKLECDNENYYFSIDDFENYRILPEELNYILYNHNMYKLRDYESQYIKVLKNQKIKKLSFEKDKIKIFGDGLFRKLKSNIEIAENITEISLPNITNIKLYFDILYSYLECRIIFDYNGKEVNYFDETENLRDIDKEDEVFIELLSYGFIQKDRKLILNEDDKIYDFLDNVLPNLTEKYEIFTSKKIDNSIIMKKMVINNNFSIGQNGIMSYNFDVDGINQNELNEVFKALRNNKKYYKLKNNNVVSLKENNELNDLSKIIDNLGLSSSDIDLGYAEIPKYRALYIDSLKSNYNNINTNNLFDKFIENFSKYKNMNVSFDKFDMKTLRDYQKDGVKWLTTIYKCDFGGILADEMGLGKSIQTISFIKQILKEKKDAKILIVAPTSLIYNWQREFEKFGKDLKYVVVAENKNHRLEIFNNINDYNIFITTYGLIRNDNDEYENINFELCVIDEAQAIKNYQAGMTKEIKKIKSKCKIALSGTPVENNITELWSIFDYIMPGYLNSLIKFKEKYNIKDVTEDDLKVLKDLSSQISPFILRRKKSDVYDSLPEKVENKIYVELPHKQKMLYLKELNDTKKEMDEIISTEGFQKARMKILMLLTKLRQICIDPSVLYENYDGERIKIEELINIIKKNIENNHKMLIFSSFKRVLENIKPILEKENISYYMIDGSVKSKERLRMVESFNEDDTNCFLITLKAGGNGLNLVGADTVIHLDIWWNPQVENQATDRAHRIGQTKKVTVIKLITKGTIEERIVELQEKKKILSDNLIEGKDNMKILTSLTEKDIKKLLSTTEE